MEMHLLQYNVFKQGVHHLQSVTMAMEKCSDKVGGNILMAIDVFKHAES